MHAVLDTHTAPRSATRCSSTGSARSQSGWQRHSRRQRRSRRRARRRSLREVFFSFTDTVAGLIARLAHEWLGLDKEQFGNALASMKLDFKGAQLERLVAMGVRPMRL